MDNKEKNKSTKDKRQERASYENNIEKLKENYKLGIEYYEEVDKE